MLVSPSEPAPFRQLGKVSPMPERYGSDFLILSPHLGTVGVQRKEINDLIVSLLDGRVEEDILKQQALNQGVWIIEGELHWTPDGHLLSHTHSAFTRAQFLGICFSLQSRRLWVLRTSSQTETIESLSLLQRWVMKPHHTSLSRRPSPKSVWGTPNSKETMVHIMQGFPGVGEDRANRIIGTLGRLPFVLDPLLDLTTVEGIGKGTVSKISQLLQPPPKITDLGTYRQSRQKGQTEGVTLDE